MSTKHTGFVEEFFETGCEGICWMFWEDGKKGYDQLIDLEDGDCLKIFSEKGEILFDGKICRDWWSGWTPRVPRWIKLRRIIGLLKRFGVPNLPDGQPQTLGLWIHWTQKGWKPEDWAKLFLRGWEGEKPYRAELIKTKE